jgi:YVTN family beta-propeller protein
MGLIIRLTLHVVALGALGFAAMAVCSHQVTAQGAGGYHVTKTIHVGGEGGWDYLTCDPVARRLYVSHGMSVVVINTESLKVAGQIPKTEGVHGIALAQDLGRGYISNGQSNTVSVFDLASLGVVRNITVGSNPDAILYDPWSHRVFVFNGRSHDATVIDATKDSVIATIPLGGKPEFSQTDRAGRVYVNIEDKSEIAVIDANALKVKNRWPLAPGEEPSGLALDVDHHRLFSVCGNKLMVVVDAEKGNVLASLPIGDRTDGCVFDPGTGLVFSSNGEGTVTVVREESPSLFTVLANVATKPGARTIAVDADRHILYLPTADFGPAPAPTPERPRPRPAIVPDSFVILQLEQQ